jgi:hypothetical protein
MSRVNEDREQGAPDEGSGWDKDGKRQRHEFEKEQIKNDGWLSSQDFPKILSAKSAAMGTRYRSPW